MNNPEYKAYLESAMSFNRKLNEERKMRLPYIDSQTGIAQRSYNSERHKRDRMPGLKQGQIYSYPQKRWRKRNYQYLRHFMAPPQAQINEHYPQNGGESEMHTISQVENPNAANAGASAVSNATQLQASDDSNNSGGGAVQESKWEYYDDDEAFLDEDLEPEPNSDSDYDYGDSYGAKKKKSKGGRGGRGSKGGGRR